MQTNSPIVNPKRDAVNADSYEKQSHGELCRTEKIARPLILRQRLAENDRPQVVDHIRLEFEFVDPPGSAQ